MFDKNQLTILTQELDSNRIKTREKGNINLSYIEGFDVIDTANKVFGFGNWSYSISKLDQVSQELNQNQNNVVCYKAVVQIQIHNTNHTLDVNRQDVGFGTGVAKSLADAHEGAAKEAVTDAIKRCFRSFGNQFGNSLYDKTKNHQNSAYQQNQNQNYNQRQPQNNQQQQQPYQNPNQTRNTQQNNSSFNQYEYQSLFNLGLNIVENNGFLIVTGDDIFSKKDSIKACGFRFDSKSKTWYKAIEQGAA
ncbi:putative Rad52/22 family double-strand break repair protein [Arcobacter venerupis]|uniref:Rad52/22 family double-strand break repair protein n=1 Tax=Arcobacter venerupis TaxID=1054033 RepID=A0AAE7E4V8_9BACT|nr:Rad52/Rad22 family DNA repair protein [Arcobacter venerupis]QKF67824.1 putative Rad52/22 family double-strand break repair protein [Arcobacter venerupis]RWS49432.1 DNA repair protein Rad52 [Arcobacter venerupis]